MSEAQHIVKSYEQDLQHLRDLVTKMGGLVECQLAFAAQAVTRVDAAAAAAAIEQDPHVDGLQREIEDFVIRLLALRQPMALDLRQIIAALKMTGDLERIGDYAANVAKRSLVLDRFNLSSSLVVVGNMARLVQENLKLTIDAIEESDAEKAIRVWRSDEAIDHLYTAIFRELITYMMEDPRSIGACTHLLFIAKNLERIGDHATNVAEVIHYAATGEVLADARPKGDTLAFAMMHEGEGE